MSYQKRLDFSSIDYTQPDAPQFDGRTYQPELDGERLDNALHRVYELMRDGQPRTLQEIATAVGCSEAGASARLRDFRKTKFASFGVRAVRRRRAGGSGLRVYWLTF